MPADVDAAFRADPECCGTPMVHNSWTQEYECADAYFTLVDEGFGEAVLIRATAEDVGPELAKTLTHWRASCIPNRSVDPRGDPMINDADLQAAEVLAREILRKQP